MLLLTALTSLALADEKAAEDCVQTKVWDSYADGWSVRTMTADTLAPGKTRNYLVTLYAGNEYRISACGDPNVANLDVLLYDAKGAVVTRDDSADREPHFSFSPPSTASYYVVVYLREVRDSKTDGGVAMAVTYK